MVGRISLARDSNSGPFDLESDAQTVRPLAISPFWYIYPKMWLTRKEEFGACQCSRSRHDTGRQKVICRNAKGDVSSKDRPSYGSEPSSHHLSKASRVNVWYELGGSVTVTLLTAWISEGVIVGRKGLMRRGASVCCHNKEILLSCLNYFERKSAQIVFYRE